MPLFPGAAHIVEAAKDGEVEYWVAGTTPDKAIAAVLLIVGPAWRLRLTDRLLPPREVAALRLREGGVLRLRRRA